MPSWATTPCQPREANEAVAQHLFNPKNRMEINVRAPLYQNHADDDGVDGDGGEDDDDVDDKDRG